MTQHGRDRHWVKSAANQPGCSRIPKIMQSQMSGQPREIASGSESATPDVSMHERRPLKRREDRVLVTRVPAPQPERDQFFSYSPYGKPVVSFAINGAYVPGATTFGSFGATLESHQGCANGSGTCSETSATNTYSTWGHFDLVIGMNLGYYVPLDWGGKSAVDGGAGFETAIAVTFPKLAGSSSVNLAAKEKS